jgi:molybdate transport system substrate-binding protein
MDAAGIFRFGGMTMTRTVSATLAAAAMFGLAATLLPIGSAHAADVTALISNALKTSMPDLAPQFDKATGHKLAISYGSTEPLSERIAKGEAVDFAVVGNGAAERLIKQGRLVGAAHAVIARSGLGVAIRKGAPKPDLGTVEAFKRTMLNAKSIAYNERGLSGIYLQALFKRLGIADALKAKTKDSAGATTVGKGEAEIGISQASEVALVAGVDLGGLLPAEVQNYTVFTGAVVTAAKQPEAARALLAFLASPAAVAVMKAKGLDAAE